MANKDRAREPQYADPAVAARVRARGTNPSGKGRHQHRSQISLAAALRDKYSDEWISNFLGSVAMGVDPAVPRNEDGTPRDGGTGVVPLIDWTTRMKALKFLLERRDGMPAQHVHIQAEIAASVQSTHTTVTTTALRGADPAKKRELRGLLRHLLHAGPGVVRDPVVVPAVEVERVDSSDVDED